MKTPMMIDGQPVHQVERQLDRRSHPARGELAQEERGQDAERQRDRGRDPDQDRRARRSSGAIPPPGSRTSGRRLVKKSSSAALAPALDDREDDDHEHGDGRERGDQRDGLDEPVDDPPPAHAPVAAQRERSARSRHQPAPVRWNSNRRTISCATRFVTSADHEQDRREVEERRGLQLRLRALELRGDPAGQRVAGLEQRAVDPRAAPPITCVTAIASPSARPSPRISAAARPAATTGGRRRARSPSGSRRARALLPRARAARLRKSSRQMLATIGTTMIASIERRRRGSRSRTASPLKIGRKPNQLLSHGSRWSGTNGPSTRIPQRPSTTLGIAASISTSAPTTPRIRAAPARSGRARSRSRAAPAITSAIRRRDSRSVEAGQRTEHALVDVPRAARQEREPEGLERELGAADHLVGDRDHDRDRPERREQRQQTAAGPRPSPGAAACRRAPPWRGSCSSAGKLTRAPARTGACHRIVTGSEPPFSPSGAGCEAPSWQGCITTRGERQT